MEMQFEYQMNEQLSRGEKKRREKSRECWIDEV